jgi:hypothetical protein
MKLEDRFHQFLLQNNRAITKLCKRIDVVVWFAKAYFEIKVKDIAPLRDYNEKLQELGCWCDKKYPLQDHSSNCISQRDGRQKLMGHVVDGNNEICHGKN